MGSGFDILTVVEEEKLRMFRYQSLTPAVLAKPHDNDPKVTDIRKNTWRYLGSAQWSRYPLDHLDHRSEYT